jgi:2-methylcitrate synthase
MSGYRTLSSNFSWALEDLEWPVTSEVGTGLSGVIATGTRVSWLDPSSGTLEYRGVPIERLAGFHSFEEIAHLLITGKTPQDDADAFTAFQNQLRASRDLPEDVVKLVRSLDPTIHPTSLLRAGISALGCHEMSHEDELSGERHWRELRIIAQIAALVAQIARHRADLPPALFHSDYDLAYELLRAMQDHDPDPEDVHSLNLLWVLFADHGLDAPTFTSMVVASTLADPYYNVVAGLSALRGFKLGGAGENVLKQILPLETPEAARLWVASTITSGGRIAGFGHRLYHIPDPRVVLLRKEVAAQARRKGVSELFDIARAVEDEALRQLAPRGVHVNINFYAALLFHLLGADGPLLPCMYMVGRMAGLMARVREALENPRLYRPLDRYVGHPERHVDAGGGQ